MAYYTVEVYHDSESVTDGEPDEVTTKMDSASAIAMAYDVASSEAGKKTPQPQQAPLQECYVTGFYVPGQTGHVMVREID